jgi:membrane protein DedA with SNARE-associated domain
VLAIILVAGYVGGSLQFLLIRGGLRRVVLAILERLGVGQERLDRLAAWLSRRGGRGVAVARATPAVRVGAIAASGLAGLKYRVFLGGLLVGNGVFVGAHFAIGYFVGPPAGELVTGLGGAGLGVVVLVAFGALGAFGWRVLRRRGLRSPDTSAASGYAGWLEGACPACLVLTVMSTEAQETAAPSSNQQRMPKVDG